MLRLCHYHKQMLNAKMESGEWRAESEDDVREWKGGSQGGRELRHETMGKYRARVVDAYWMTIIIIKNDENCETEMAAA